MNKEVEMSVIAEGTHFIGDYVSFKDIRICGLVKGRVFCAGHVEVAPGGIIEGDIMAHHIEFYGTMTSGNLYARDTLMLKAGGKVSGDLFFGRLAVELDSSYSGNCKVLAPEEFEDKSAPLCALLENVAHEAPLPPAEAYAPVKSDAAVSDEGNNLQESHRTLSPLERLRLAGK